MTGAPAGGSADFDMQAAWLRRFSADAEANLHAFALRLKEALPDLVAIKESGGLFRASRTVGVAVTLGDRCYALELAHGRLTARIAMVVRGITLNTQTVDPAIWFAKLAAETETATAQAKALSQSLSTFMGA